MSEDTVTCGRCGRPRAEDSPVDSLAWVVESDSRRHTWLCPACARAHLRDIEGKLPREYW
ncbi:MAG: hypothetical protein ACRDSE_07150 [Pseudonocardiaceae bacterium]